MKKVVAIGVALIAIAAAVVFFFPVITVNKVEVQGARNADVTAIEDAAGITPGENMLRIDPAAAAQRVAKVPWVEKVTVARNWPRTVDITVTEHDAVGYIKDGSTPLAVDSHGSIFLSGIQPPGAVEFARVKPDDEQAIKAAAGAVASLVPELRQQLEQVDVPNAEAVTLKFKDNKTVFWGSADREKEKAEATRIVLSREGQEGTKWNVSNPAMPSVRG